MHLNSAPRYRSYSPWPLVNLAVLLLLIIAVAKISQSRDHGRQQIRKLHQLRLTPPNVSNTPLEIKTGGIEAPSGQSSPNP